MSDTLLDIATGLNRKQKQWKNTKITWTELISKLSKTHYTPETHDEFMTADKERQAELKDVGGFVGGYLVNGRRKPDSVQFRQIITLDLDHNPLNTWGRFQALYGRNISAAVYSTHKHTPSANRLRLIIPVNRKLYPDEYTAISRRIAGDLGIESFDPTTFEPNRLMFWPSTSKGSEYYFKANTGAFLDADKQLARYHNWQDSSEWPISSKFRDSIDRSAQKQGNPLMKPGLIGGFCRTYSITEAIDTYLSEIYEPAESSEGSVRYTYKYGSTSGGLIVYNDEQGADVFAYSHHGTDPAGGRLSNAFDLVRVHLFGLKDEDITEDTPVNKLPSFKEMTRLIAKDPQVSRLMTDEKISDAKKFFSQPFSADALIDEALEDDGSGSADQTETPNSIIYNPNWKEQISKDNRGVALPEINNIVLVLENDDIFRGVFAYDDFVKRPVALKSILGRAVNQKDSSRFLKKADISNISHYLETSYEIYSKDKQRIGLDVVANKNFIHPVKDYLKRLHWDGVARLDMLLIHYMGAEDSEYIRTVTRKTLCAAVARVYEPGCKFDHMLTLVGPEGHYKSTLFKKLAGRWFSDSFTTVKGKEAYEQLQGVWIVEVGELAGMRKADIDLVKHYISKEEDRYRVAYGEFSEDFPRQCILIGTTNRINFIQGTTGGRKFWAVPVNKMFATKDVFKHLTRNEVDQIWAEAVTKYKLGETRYLSAAMEIQAKEMQLRHTEVDDRTGIVIEFLDHKLPVNWEEMATRERMNWLTLVENEKAGSKVRERVCAPEIYVELFGGKHSDMTTGNTKYIHDIMQSLPNWKPINNKGRFKNYGVLKGYERV